MRISQLQVNLLRLLLQDASLSLEVLAEKLGKSRQSIGREIKELEEAGIIQRKTIVVDAQKVGLTMTSFVLVSLKSHGDGLLDLFEEYVRDHLPNVIESAHISGSWDLLLKVVVRDSSHFAEVHRNLTNMPNVARTRGHHVIGAPRQYPLPLEIDKPIA